MYVSTIRTATKRVAMAQDLKSWLKRLKKGDQSAFLPLYEKTAPGLLRFLLWKTNGDRPLSEDILQEGYVRFLINLDRLESDQELAVQSYLLQIVKNCLIDKTARSPHVSKPHVQIEDMYDLADPNQTSRQERAVELRELSIAMKSLNEKDSEIIWMRDALGLSHREVADRIGISEQASRQAYVRAKRTLISELAHGLSPLLERGGDYAIPEVP
jgi:RNA polymerase sigma factor (sigma-70 family)